MPKTPHTFKLSKQAEQDINKVLKKYGYLVTATDAVEFALWIAARGEVEIVDPATTRPAARPARPKAAKEN